MARKRRVLTPAQKAAKAARAKRRRAAGGQTVGGVRIPKGEKFIRVGGTKRADKRSIKVGSNRAKKAKHPSMDPGGTVRRSSLVRGSSTTVRDERLHRSQRPASGRKVQAKVSAAHKRAKAREMAHSKRLKKRAGL